MSEGEKESECNLLNGGVKNSTISTTKKNESKTVLSLHLPRLHLATSPRASLRFAPWPHPTSRALPPVRRHPVDVTPVGAEYGPDTNQ
jgi:hypothetical protein